MRKIKIRKIIMFLFYAGLMVFMFSKTASASIVLKTVATNPSEKTQAIFVKSYLPKGVKPEHIVNKGEFEIGYDFDKSLYYVYQEIELAAKESKVLEVEIKDIWIIEQDLLNALNEHLRQMMEVLKKTEYYQTTLLLSEDIEKRLKQIEESQQKDVISVEEHISRYESNERFLEEAKKSLASLEELIVELGGAVPNKKLLGEIYSADNTLSFEKTNLARENLKTLILNIVISNPLLNKPQEMALKRYLPQEVKPEYVIDSNGLDVMYDVEKGIYYLYKDKVELEGGQSKQYAVEIKNVWFIPPENINSLKNRSQKMLEMLEGSSQYESGSYLAGTINVDLEAISNVQAVEGLKPEDIIGNYRVNLEKLNSAQKNLVKLEKIVIQTGGTPAVSSLEQWEEGEGSEEIPRVREKIKIIGRSIFRGKIPSVSVTWSLIYMIIGFLAVISFAFFILQFVQHKQLITDNLTGVYTRKYVSGKLPQELIRSKAQNLKYAVLMIDVDGFKDYNDRYGHLVGDTILREAVTVIKKNLRPLDIISRYGGDEFFIGLPNKDRESARIVAERLVQAVSSRKIKVHVGAEALLVSISVGVTIFPEDAETYEALINKADEALYRAKGRGGNGVFVYGT